MKKLFYVYLRSRNEYDPDPYSTVQTVLKVEAENAEEARDHASEKFGLKYFIIKVAAAN